MGIQFRGRIQGSGTDATSNLRNLPQTTQGKQLSNQVQQIKQYLDTGKDVADAVSNPKKFAESKASKALPEGAKSEYERLLEDIKKAAEENANKLRNKVKELYDETIGALCGGDGSGSQDPGNGAQTGDQRVPKVIGPLPVVAPPGRLY